MTLDREAEPAGTNLRTLAETQPGLADFLSRAEVAGLELLPTPSGRPTARREGRWLHSTRDPLVEAERIAKASRRVAADTVVVAGAGLGYGIEAALSLPGVEKVIVCEAEAARLASLVAARDLRGFLNDQRLTWMVEGDPSSILGVLATVEARGLTYLGLASLEAESPDWYRGLRAAVDRWTAKENINASTLARFGRLWVRNLARNAARFPDAPGLRPLEGLMSGLPALVLAAGPSLDEVLPFMCRARERCVIVAVDTALRSLLAFGIEPDFLVVVDPQYWNWRHVADLESPASILVSEPAVFPPVLRRRHRGIFLAESLFPLGRVLAGSGRGQLGAGGSVATSAWDLARLLGCSPVVMAGLDLGFPAGHTHAKASLFEQRALAAANRLSPAATAQTAALFGAPTEPARANDGGEVRSDVRMALYAWWFESRLARGDAPPTLCMAPKGRAIPGMSLVGLDLLSEAPRVREDIDRRLESLGSGQAAAVGKEAMLDDFRRLIAGLRRIEAVSRRGREAASRGRKALARGESAAADLAALSDIDHALHQSEVKDIAGFLLPPLADLVGAPPADLAGSLTVSEALYAHVAASAHEHLEILEACAADLGIAE